MKYLKSCLLKGNLLNTTVLLISILFIKIGILYWWNSYSLIYMSSNSITFLFIFVYGFNFLNNFLNSQFSTFF